MSGNVRRPAIFETTRQFNATLRNMAVSDGYRAYVLEQLDPAGMITSRRMFGGVGIYCDGHFFALIDDDTLYFKVDASTRPQFEAAGSTPFRPYGDDRTMSYYTVPPDVLEDADELASWVRNAVGVARRAATR